MGRRAPARLFRYGGIGRGRPFCLGFRAPWVWGISAMSQSVTRGQAIRLSLVILTAGAICFFGLYQIGSRRGLFDDTLELRAGFREVHGIDRGVPVRFRGIEAGQVIAIDLPEDPTQKITVRFKVQRRFQSLIPRDSRLRIVSDGMFGAKILNIEPGTPGSGVLAEGDEMRVVDAKTPGEVLAEASETFREIRESQGTLAKLLRSDEIHYEMVRLVRQMQETFAAAQQGLEKTQGTLQEGKEAFASLKHDAEAIKRLPIVRSYVQDAVAILYRPDQERDRRVFNACDLFEPGSSVLNDVGRSHLNNLASWLQTDKTADSELVVVSYFETEGSDLSGPAAQVLTLKRSEAVATFLRERLRAHRVGWLSRRKIVSLGMGQSPPPMPEKESLPPERTEIILFRPR